MSQKRFENQVVMITGAAAGIGRTLAERFAGEGAKLVLVDIDTEIAKIAEAIEGESLGLAIDVRDSDSADCALASTLEEFARIDVLVNNAGIGPLAPAEDYPTKKWDDTFAINLRAAFLFAKAVSRPMIAQNYGRIINMASQAALVGIEGHVAYCASKAGMIGMTHAMALEWGRHGVTVNAVSPTVTETALGLSGWSGERGERARAEIPTGRFAKPDEVANMVLFVAEEGSAMINGSNLVIDGGYTIR